MVTESHPTLGAAGAGRTPPAEMLLLGASSTALFSGS